MDEIMKEGRICWDWREGCRTPRYECLLWTFWTWPTMAFHGPWHCPCSRACCPGTRPQSRLQSGTTWIRCWADRWTAMHLETNITLNFHSFVEKEKGKAKAKETYPASFSMSRAMKSSTSVFPKVVWNGEPEKEGHPHDEEVPHRVHVCELQEREPHRSYRYPRKISHDTRYSSSSKVKDIIECIAHQQGQT